LKKFNHERDEKSRIKRKNFATDLHRLNAEVKN